MESQVNMGNMGNMANMMEEFNKQMQNMGDAFEKQKQEMSEAFEYRVSDTNRTYSTLAVKTHQPLQSTHPGIPTFFVLWFVFLFSIAAITVILMIKNKRKQAKAREEYKKYDEEMYRAQKDNTEIPDNDVIKAQTADMYKDGISELLDDDIED